VSLKQLVSKLEFPQIRYNELLQTLGAIRAIAIPSISVNTKFGYRFTLLLVIFGNSPD